jgi:hypothetical protein
MKTRRLLPFLFVAAFVWWAPGGAAQSPSQAPEFTPEQLAIVQRMIDEAVARNAAGTPVEQQAVLPVSTRAVDGVGDSSAPAPNLCVLGFVTKACRSREEGGTMSLRRGAASDAQLTTHGSAAGGDPEFPGDKSAFDLAPMGIGPVIRSDTLTFAPAARSSAGLHADPSVDGVRSRGDILFSEDGSTAILRFDSEVNRLLESPEEIVAAMDGWSLQIASPVDDPDRKRANLATLDGFSSGLSMTFEYNRQRSDLRAKNPEALRRDLGVLCAGVGLPVVCTYEQAWEAATDEVDDKALRSARAKALAVFQRRQFKWLRDYALRMTIGRERFDYLMPDLQQKQEHRVGWGIGATAAFVSPSRRWMYLLGADYQEGDEAADAVVVCPPSSGVSSVTCVEGAFGSPSAVARKILSAEMRSNFGHIGYSLKIAHDFESDRTGVDLPIYLLRNASGALSGGVRLGWSQATDVVFGIFLSSPLSLNP